MAIIQKKKVIAIVTALALAIMQMLPVISNADTAEFEINDGVLVRYNGEDAEVRVPTGVTQIGEGAFLNKSKIAEVYIPQGVTNIGKRAFEGCKNLKYVQLPQDLEYIGEKAFYSSGIQFAKMPGGLKSIGARAYYNSKISAVSLNEGLENIGASAFETCYRLEGLLIPESVTAVGKSVAGDNDSAFKWMLFKNDQTAIEGMPTDVMSITYYGGEPSTIKTLYQAEFDKKQAKGKVTSLKFGEKSTFKPVTNISITNRNVNLTAGQTANIEAQVEPSDATDQRLTYLSEKDNIASVDKNGLITGVKLGTTNVWVFSADGTAAQVTVNVEAPVGREFEISATGVLSAYYGHDMVITIPTEVTTIAENAFSGEKNIKKVVFGDNVNTIEKSAFANCSALEEIDLSGAAALKSIGKEAFSKCTNLREIRIPVNVASIAEGAFSGCIGLKNVHFEADSKVEILSDGVFSGCANLESVNIPTACLEIGKGAFSGDSKLVSIEFNDKLKTIGKSAFYAARSLVEVKVPEGVTTIGEEAFYGNSNLEKITLPSTFTQLQGKKVFAFIFDNKEAQNVGKLTNVVIAEGNPKYRSEKGLVYEGTTLVYIPQGIEHAVVADGTTIIGKFAAVVHQNLKTVVIPKGVTKIEESAFANCDGIESVKLPDTLEEVGVGVFLGCEECTDLVIPKSVKKIGGLAFYELENLRELVIPDGVTKIEKHAVAGNDEMQHLILSRNLVEVAENGCSFYPNAEELYLPEKLEKIGPQGFGAFQKVQYLELPKSLKQVGSEAFSLMNSLKSVYIPGELQVPVDIFNKTTSPKIYIFSHNANDTVKNLAKTPQYELIDLSYEKAANRKVELQGFEKLLNDTNHESVFAVKINEAEAKNKEIVRLNITVKEGEKELKAPFGTMKLVIELTPEQENGNYKIYKENNGAYAELETKRVDRFLVGDINEFGSVVVLEKQAVQSSGGSRSHASVVSTQKTEDKSVVTVKNEAAKELVKDINDQSQANQIDKLVEDKPVTEKKEALKALTDDTKTKLSKTVLAKYTDVKTGEWYSKDLAVVISMGLVKGTGKATVSPLKDVTGKELMSMLVRCTGKEVKPVVGDKWYEPYEKEAAILGLNSGLTFDVSKDLTRAEVAQMLYKYVRLTSKDTYNLNLKALDGVKDAKDIPAEYKEAVAYMYQMGIIKGYEDGSFLADKEVSRIEVISLLARLLAM